MLLWMAIPFGSGGECSVDRALAFIFFPSGWARDVCSWLTEQANGAARVLAPVPSALQACMALAHPQVRLAPEAVYPVRDGCVDGVTCDVCSAASVWCQLSARVCSLSPSRPFYYTLSHSVVSVSLWLWTCG